MVEKAISFKAIPRIPGRVPKLARFLVLGIAEDIKEMRPFRKRDSLDDAVDRILKRK